MSNVFRKIPSVNELLETQPLRQLIGAASRSVVVEGVRQFLDNMRSELHDAADKATAGPMELAESIADWIRAKERLSLQPVINATGIILHTGLGRAPLPHAAIDAMKATAEGYASVELDLPSGQRSQRVEAVAPLLCELTGAESAIVVNNNAGATLLTLTGIAYGKEVIVSRGHLVEIGGSFRLPQVMTSAGAILREVGATNRTRIGDFREAMTAETAALLRVHPSNYAIVGFTEQPSLEELVELGRKRKVPVIDDIGSGALHDLSEYGLLGEPVARDSIAGGADLVLFSGDKLLGGPQCGIIVGNTTYVERLAKHPMMRALRVDKLTLAALAATLKLHRDWETAKRDIPVVSLLSTPLENLRLRAERIAPQLAATEAVASASPQQDHTYLGGGSVPTQEIPTWCIEVEPAGQNVDSLARKLRLGEPALMCRVQRGRLVIDLRSVFPAQDLAVVDAFVKLSQEADENAGRATKKPAENARDPD